MGRERQLDFQTGDEEYRGTSSERRPDAVSHDYRTAFSLGPIELQDGNQGILIKRWRVRAIVNPVSGDDEVFLARENEAGDGWRDDTFWFSILAGDPAISELDLAFQQNGDPVVAMERPSGIGGAPEVWVHRFEPLTETFRADNFGAGRCPRAIMDQPTRPECEVLVFYLSDADDELVCLQQSDDYAVPTALAEISAANQFVQEVARTRDNRLELTVVSRNIGTARYTLHYWLSPFFMFWAENEAGLGVEPEAFTIVNVVDAVEADDSSALGIEPLTVSIPNNDIQVEATDSAEFGIEPVSVAIPPNLIEQHPTESLDLGVEPWTTTITQTIIPYVAPKETGMDFGVEPQTVTISAH